MESDWKHEIESQREAKEEYFGEDPRSPIPRDEQDEFDGLSYYPVDEDYRFEVELHEHEEKETVTVGTSTGGERDYLRWGEFRLRLDGQDVVIQAYKAEADDDRLWVPFRDETSGEASYGAGRYIDLEEDRHRLDEDSWILDFNEAYNPTCAYSEQYECPLPPAENWLEVEIEAGEKNYH